MTVKAVLFVFLLGMNSAQSSPAWSRCSKHAWEFLDVSRKLCENGLGVGGEHGLWSTTSVMNSQQDTRTIDPPFSWPFPMVPSRLRCHSDNGDRRVRRASVSCCCHASVRSDSPYTGFLPSAALRGPVRH